MREEDAVHISRSRWVALAGTMTALALVGNYSLVAIPSVEFGTAVLFVTAYVFGLGMGIWCTLLMSLVFGIMNPWGAFIPQIWIFQVIGWTYVCATAALLGRNSPVIDYNQPSFLKLAAVGAFITLVFDLLTNAGFSIAFGYPYFLSILTGLPFTTVHVLSNALIIPLAVPRLELAIKRDLGGAIWSAEADLHDSTEE